MKKIIQQDNKILRAIASEVPTREISGKKIQEILHDMNEALASQHDGVAIAAPQIAVSLRIFLVNPQVYDTMKTDGPRPLVFINPRILKMSRDRKAMSEGCLSVRPWYGKVKRASKATVEAWDERGEKFTIDGIGLLAQIFQHEIDHLNGVLFIDKAKDLRELPGTEIGEGVK